jgi:hypothetical protein
MFDWSPAVRKNLLLPGHKEIFYAFCTDCGIRVEPCWRCKNRKEYLNGACQTCWNSFSSPCPDDMPAEPFFLCTRCDLNRGLLQVYGYTKSEVNIEIWKYDYKPVCSCCPLSPTNVIRIPRFVELPFHYRENEVSWKKIHAKEAFQEELKFSGNWAEAMALYSFFFHNTRKEYPAPSLKRMLKLGKR